MPIKGKVKSKKKQVNQIQKKKVLKVLIKNLNQVKKQVKNKISIINLNKKIDL